MTSFLTPTQTDNFNTELSQMQKIKKLTESVSL